MARPGQATKCRECGALPHAQYFYSDAHGSAGAVMGGREGVEGLASGKQKDGKGRGKKRGERTNDLQHKVTSLAYRLDPEERS